jgi:histone acetyltransferase (RNA polymerase elongator complex component)
MMIGLPKSTALQEIRTAEFAVSVGADEARIYPTVVFKDTELFGLAISGQYEPLSLQDAILRAAAVFEILVKSKIKVLRIGLCDSENLHNNDTYYAGPNHAAMGELVEGEYYYNVIKEKLSKIKLSDKTVITVIAPKGQTSKIIGQSKINKIRLLREYGISSMKVTESEEVEKYSILLKAEERK